MSEVPQRESGESDETDEGEGGEDDDDGDDGGKVEADSAFDEGSSSSSSSSSSMDLDRDVSRAALDANRRERNEMIAANKRVKACTPIDLIFYYFTLRRFLELMTPDLKEMCRYSHKMFFQHVAELADFFERHSADLDLNGHNYYNYRKRTDGSEPAVEYKINYYSHFWNTRACYELYKGGYIKEEWPDQVVLGVSDDGIDMASNMGTTSTRKTTPWFGFIMNVAEHIQHLGAVSHYFGMSPFVSKALRHETKGTPAEPVRMSSDLFFKLLLHESEKIGNANVLVVRLTCDSPGMSCMGRPGLGKRNFCINCKAEGMTISKNAEAASSKNNGKVHHFTPVSSTPLDNIVRKEVAAAFPGNELIRKMAKETEADLMTKEDAIESANKYEEKKETGEYKFKSKISIEHAVAHHYRAAVN